MLEEGKSIPELICSNVKSIINQNQFIFETLWNKAIPAEERIREIKESLLPVETKIITENKEIISHLMSILANTNLGVSTCTVISGIELAYKFKPIFEGYKNIVRIHQQGKIKNGVRFLTHIENDKEQVALVKKFLDMGFYIRHLKNIPSLNFGVSERQLESTIEKMTRGKMMQSLLHSTEPLYISHFQSLFEELWDSAIDVEERIRQIESGIASEHTRVIENPLQSKNLFLQTLENAQEEIMIMFPSLNSIKRQSQIGFFSLLKLKNQLDFRVRILSPNADIVKEIILLEYAKEKNHNDVNKVAIRDITKQQEIRSIILMADKKQLLAIEVKDDSKETFEEATGLTTYSTSVPTVLSYVSIFESLWSQTEISDNLRIANEKLIQSEEMERDFINTAAHELRTPMQAITGYSEMDQELFDDLKKIAKT